MIIKNPDPEAHQSSAVLEKRGNVNYFDLRKDQSYTFYWESPCDQSPVSPMSVICGPWLSQPHQQYSNLRLRHPASEPLVPASEESPSASPSSEQTMLFQSVGGHLPRECDQGVKGASYVSSKSVLYFKNHNFSRKKIFNKRSLQKKV